MKRSICIGLVVLLAFALPACSAQEPQTPSPAETVGSSDPSDQIKLIAENRDLWLVTDPLKANDVQYALTDLDGNGRLELISTITEGTGLFTSTQFYEVSEDFNKLQRLEYPAGETHSEPDIGFAESFRCYKGEYGTFLIAIDEMANGYEERYYSQVFLTLQNGTVEAATISYCMVLAEDSNGDGEPEMHAYYYAPGGVEEESITSTEFAASADTFFGYNYDRNVMDLRWKQFDEEKRESKVDIPADLTESWNAFGLRKDEAAFGKLFVSPAAYYDELYENGESAAIVYGIECLADYWMLHEIRSQLDARFALESGIDCYLVIGQDNLASFHFDDPTDARDPIKLEGMSVSMAENGVGEPAAQGEEGSEGEGSEVGADVETSENAEEAVAGGNGKEGEAGEGEAEAGEAADWLAVFGTDNGLHRFEAYVGPQDGRLYVTWYRWDEDGPGADPEILHLIFTNGVG